MVDNLGKGRNFISFSETKIEISFVELIDQLLGNHLVAKMLLINPNDVEGKAAFEALIFHFFWHSLSSLMNSLEYQFRKTQIL